MEGYGWLVIVDHPQADIYSLYGHLSPSRWSIEKGASLQKGELIAYLGDSDENGGSPKNPLRTHLHFGVRVGQRADYPDNGQWRWMAGWVKLCPQELGWLQPSLVIASQDNHFAESYQLTAGYFTKWWPDLLLVSVYLVGSVCMLIFAIKKDQNIFLFITSFALAAAGVVLGISLSYLIFAMAVLLLGVGLYRQFLRPGKADVEESEKNATS
jgi:murein DD-endopeptidase MepM/ murein hydrolase activator NlpD